MADDWDTVTVLRKRAPNKATMKSESALNQARRAGTSIDTQQKCKYRTALILATYTGHPLSKGPIHVTFPSLILRFPKSLAGRSESFLILAGDSYSLKLLFLLADGASSNKQHVTTKNTAKLDRETEELRHASVSTDTGKVIMQARQAKAMSQKDLATVSENIERDWRFQIDWTTTCFVDVIALSRLIDFFLVVTTWRRNCV